MRRLLHQQLNLGMAGTPVQGNDPAPRIYQLGALGIADIPASPAKPFISTRQLPSARYREVRETSRAERQTWQIYVYDEPGSLLRIDELMHQIEDVVETLDGMQSPSGAWCFEALWVGVSQDFRDENYDAVARFATVQLSTNR